MSTLTAPVASAAAAVKGLHCTPLATARGALDCRPRSGWALDTELKLRRIQFGCFVDHHGPAPKISGPDLSWKRFSRPGPT